MTYDWNFGAVLTAENLDLLLAGATTTLLLSAVSMIFGTLGGVGIGALATVGSPHFLPLRRSMSSPPGLSRQGIEMLLRTVRGATLSLVDVVRAVPLLLTVLLSYYAFPVFLPTFDRTDIFTPCAVAFSVNLAAFTGELVRAGVVALPPGSISAARALGIRPSQAWRHIVLPQIARDILPAQVLLYITIIKMTTLASAVALYEILHSGENIIQRTYRPLEVYVVIGAFFVVLIVPLAVLARRMETASIFRRRGL